MTGTIHSLELASLGDTTRLFCFGGWSSLLCRKSSAHKTVRKCPQKGLLLTQRVWISHGDRRKPTASVYPNTVVPDSRWTVSNGYLAPSPAPG